jgi:hypothetical protein
MLKKYCGLVLNDKTRLLKNIAIVFGYSLVAFIILRKLLFSQGTIGYGLDWIFPPYSSQYVQMAANDFFSINSYSGGNINYVVPALFLDQMLGFFGFLGLNGEIISKSFCFIILTLIGLSLFCLCRTIAVGYLASFVAGLFYMVNPLMFNRFWQGHITYLLSYALAPLVLLMFFKCTWASGNRFKLSLIVGLVFGVTWAQGQFAVMVFVLLMLYCFFVSNLKTFLARIGSLIIVSSIAFLMNFHWIFIALTTQPTVYGHISATETAINLSPKLIDILRLSTGSYLFRFDNVILSFLPIMVAFFALLLKPKDKMVFYFSVVAVISLFLAKGINPPLSSIYNWLSANIPASSLFRDVYHLAFIPALALSVLIGFATSRLMEIKLGGLEPFYKLNATTVKTRKGIIQPMVTIVISVVLIVLLLSPSSAVLSGDFNGTVRTYNLGDDYKQTYDYLEKLSGDFRIAWLPIASVGYSVSSPLAWTGRNPMITLSPKPSLDADYQVWQRYSAFLAKTISTNRTKYFSDLLDLTSVEYVVTANDFVGHYPTPANQTVLLDGQIGFDLVKTFGDIRVFRNNNSFSHIYSTDDVAIVAGDLSVLSSWSYYSQFMNKSLPATFFASQLNNETTKLYDFVDSIIIQDNDFQDIVFSFLPSDYILTAGAYATHNYPLYGWTYSGYQWPSDWHFAITLDDAAITGTNDTLLIPFTVSQATDYEVWAKVYFGMESVWGIGGLNTSLSFSVDGNNLGSVVTKASAVSWDQGFRWINLGNMDFATGEHTLEVLGKDGINVVERVAITPSDVLTEATNTAYAAMQDKHVLLISNVEKTAESNDLILPSTQWSINASEGVALRSIAPTQLSNSLFVPTAGNYELYLRTAQSDIVNQQESQSVSKLIDDFESPSEWLTLGEGSASVSPQFVKNGNYSLQYSLDINKTSTEGFHALYKEIPSSYGNWSSYDTLSFWVYPKTESSEPKTYIVIGARDSENEWNGAYAYVPNNQWSYCQIDISDWSNKSDINVLRLVCVGDQWGTTTDEQHIDFYVDALRLDKSVSADFKWIDMGVAHLNEGYNNISFNITGSGVGVDMLALSRVLDANANQTQSITQPILSYSKINAAEYLVHVNASAPFFLVFNDNFDSLWQASINGVNLEHFEVNSFANAYYANETGEFTIVITFGLEKLHAFGIKIAFLSILICVSIILIPKRYFDKAKGRLISKLRTKSARVAAQ